LAGIDVGYQLRFTLRILCTFFQEDDLWLLKIVSLFTKHSACNFN
jgi:hypothetical protein